MDTKAIKKQAWLPWAALACLVVPMFASYYFDDMFSSISYLFENPSLTALGWDSAGYGLYAGGYSVLCVFGGLVIGGILLDKWGVRVSGTMFVGMMVLGAGLVTYALLHGGSSALSVAYAGVMLFGLGSEIAGTAVTRSIARWFRGGPMALAMGLQLAIARLGTAFALVLSPRLVQQLDGHVYSLAETARPAVVGMGLMALGLILWGVFVALDARKDSASEALSGAFARTEPPQKLEIFGDPGRSRSDAEEGASIPANIIVLDDAFQYRRLDASLKIVLVDYYHPVHKDMLLPWGRLRDLTSRIKAADVVIVTKSPAYLEDGERERWAQEMKLTPEQKLFFCTIGYDAPEPVFPEADSRYTYSHKLTLISGIANDAPLRSHLSDTYRIGRRLEFPDHHRYTKGDIRTIRKAVKESPTSCLMTTEKDAQRLRDVKNVPPEIRERMFYIPIKSVFLTQEDDAAFTKLITEIV